MIRINRDDIPQIAKEFSHHLTEYLRDKRSKTEVSKLRRWIADSAGTRYGEMLRFFEYHFSHIMRCTSKNDMLSIIKVFNRQFKDDIKDWREADRDSKKTTQYGRFKKKMIDVYDGVMDYKIEDHVGKEIRVGYWLAHKLNITTCPYCNRHYTFTIVNTENGPSLRPQFDHFYPKSKFPILAVCPFNMVPVCSDCNKTKEDHILRIHPYEDSFSANDIHFYIGIFS